MMAFGSGDGSMSSDSDDDWSNLQMRHPMSYRKCPHLRLVSVWPLNQKVSSSLFESFCRSLNALPENHKNCSRMVMFRSHKKGFCYMDTDDL